ncbi:MAG TPA: hypothetical protein PKV66_05085 [Candidatus Pelethenecus sp.]|nr:hypothetical protein [Candidatus Pelethenecus sp.]
MKKVKSFRLEEDVIQIIESQPNATQFIEDLVRGKKDTTPVEDYIVQTLDEINTKLNQLDKKELRNKNAFEHAAITGEKVTIPPIPTLRTRTIKDILKEINELEQARDEQLQYCQDPEEIRRIGTNYKEQTDLLWAEYHELKALDEQ